MYELQTLLPPAGPVVDEGDCKGNCPPQENDLS